MPKLNDLQGFENAEVVVCGGSMHFSCIKNMPSNMLYVGLDPLAFIADTEAEAAIAINNAAFHLEESGMCPMIAVEMPSEEKQFAEYFPAIIYDKTKMTTEDALAASLNVWRLEGQVDTPSQTVH